MAERKYDGYQLFAHSPNFIPLTIYTIDGIREACAQRLWFHAGAPALPHNTSTRTARATDPLASMSTVAHAVQARSRRACPSRVPYVSPCSRTLVAATTWQGTTGARSEQPDGMASSSSDNEDEAMAGLSLKNGGRASTRGGLLGGDLAQLDIPPSARLCGVNMSVEEDGTKVWTVTFKAKPKPASRKQRSSASSSDGQLHRLFPLRCEAKSYAWGRRGRGSLVATLACGMDDGFEVSEEREYAELWMGTHPSGPSLVSIQTPLRTLYAARPSNPSPPTLALQP